MPSNSAAYLVSKTTRPLQVSPASYTPPGPREILIKNAAVAINPLDWIKQTTGDISFNWLKYPIILGSDVAGSVIGVGSQIKAGQFQISDRVVGLAVGMDKRSNRPAEGGFQEYTILRAHLAVKIPDSMSYETACVLPLGFGTAACGLFIEDHLALQHPACPARETTGETVVVWGGSTSVGSCAIQLACAAGYQVITTCSPRNFDYVKSLGALYAFDYNKSQTSKDIVDLLKDRPCAGALAIGIGSTEACLNIVGQANGPLKGRKFVSQATPGVDMAEFPTSSIAVVGTIVQFLAAAMKTSISAWVKGVATKFIFGTDLMANEVGPAVFGGFLQEALVTGQFVPSPEPLIVGRGLDYVQEAMDKSKAQLSARKAVVLV